MKRKQKVVCKEVEYLATSVGEVDNADSVILTFRTSPKSSFESTNFALSASQARKLFGDLDKLFKTSARLIKAPHVEPEHLAD